MCLSFAVDVCVLCVGACCVLFVVVWCVVLFVACGLGSLLVVIAMWCRCCVLRVVCWRWCCGLAVVVCCMVLFVVCCLLVVVCGVLVDAV